MALTGKYAKLRDDLAEALLKGEIAEMVFGDDVGTCNFDSPTLLLPRWNTKLVEQAAMEAGTRCWKWTGSWGGGRFVISPHTHSQGYPRTRNAEAVSHYLKEAGYQAGMYYMMD